MKLYLVLVTGLLACGKVASHSMPDGNPGGGDDDAGTTGDDAGPGSLELAPTAIDFGQVSIAQAPSSQSIQITNKTGAAAHVTLAISGDDAASFTIDPGTCAGQLNNNDACMALIALTVTHDGAYAASIDASAGTVHASAPLAAMSVPATMSLSPSSDDFGDTNLASPATRQYSVTNTGQAPLPMPALALSGGAAYTIDSTTCNGTLDPGASCGFTVKFAPAAVGSQSAMVTATAGTLTAQVTIAGRGTAQLSAVRQGTGAGTVSGGGLDCGATCAATVATNPVTLTASAAGGSAFTGWGGGAAGCGTSPTCSVAINAGTIAVTAGFADLPTLTVDVNSSFGDPSVSISNPAMTCTDSCTNDYPTATTVTLRANFDASNCEQFDGWSGACFGTIGTTCTLTVNANLSTSAGFSKKSGCNPP
jgi:hypothetical protein